jgi:hypothetical protein
MKKVLMVLLVATVGAVNTYGFGIGVEGGGGYGWGNDSRGWGAVSFGIGDMYAPNGTGAVSLGFSDHYFYVGGHYKWHVLSYDVTNWFQLFIGIGPQVGIGFSFDSGNDNFYLNIAARAAFGMRFLLVEHVDIFLSLDPAIGLGLTFGDDTSGGLYGSIGGTLGIRFWF